VGDRAVLNPEPRSKGNGGAGAVVSRQAAVVVVMGVVYLIAIVKPVVFSF
jgi:hypothetical protein